MEASKNFEESVRSIKMKVQVIIKAKDDKMQAKSDLKDSKFSAMEPITES